MVRRKRRTSVEHYKTEYWLTRKGKLKRRRIPIMTLHELLASKLANVQRVMMRQFSERLYRQTTKSNSLFAWLVDGDTHDRDWYLDQSINLDMILEYMEPYDG